MENVEKSSWFSNKKIVTAIALVITAVIFALAAWSDLRVTVYSQKSSAYAPDGKLIPFVPTKK